MQSSAWLATRKSTKRSVESSANASTSSVAATADIESPLGDSMSTARRLPRDTPALSMLSKRLTMLASKGCVSRGSSALKRIAIGRLRGAVEGLGTATKKGGSQEGASNKKVAWTFDAAAPRVFRADAGRRFLAHRGPM